MVAAVDGTEPARVAGRRLPRLLRGALVAIGLSGLLWLLGLLIGAGTATADTVPAEPTQSSGLLGGLLGGLTNTIGGVLDTATSTVGQLTGDVLNTFPPAVNPPPAAQESPPPQAAPVATGKPTSVAKAEQASVPASKPARTRPAPSPPPAPHVALKPVAAPVPVVVPQPAEPVGTERANRSGPPSPGKVPSAPAMPTGSVSAGHDGPGQARGSHGVLAGQAALRPPAETISTRGRSGRAGDTTVGLPAASPD